MITQTIKQWLNKLFAWWPWKRSTVANGSDTVSDRNRGATQEPMWRFTWDRAVPLQSDIPFIIIEQEMEEILPEPRRSITEERPESVSLPFVLPLLPPIVEEGNRETATELNIEGDPSLPSPTQEQQWAFLRYLVKQGIVNEGFSEGQVPEQYT